jgi:hypothetical protein
MARSIESIYNSLVAKKEGFSELSALLPSYVTPDNPYQLLLNEISSLSKVSIWRLWLFLVACGHYTLEVMMDAFKADAEDIARRNTFGTLPWYAAKVLGWQFGFSPVWNSTDYTYEYTDTTSVAAKDARIIARVSVVEAKNMAFNSVLIKVATESAPGVLSPITAPQLTALDTYIDRIKPPGVKTITQSYPADLLRANLKIWYDGTLDLAVFQTTVEDALKLFLKNIPFDGILQLDDLVLFIRAISGVQNVQLILVEAKASYDPGFTVVPQERNPASGYFELVPTGITSSDTQIEYLPV